MKRLRERHPNVLRLFLLYCAFSSLCRGDDVTQNVSKARGVSCLWPLPLFVHCGTQQNVPGMFLSSQVLYFVLLFINHFETKHWYTSAWLVSSSRQPRFVFTMMNLYIEWHHLVVAFLVRFRIAEKIDCCGAQYLSGRMPDSQSRGAGFESSLCYCFEVWAFSFSA